MSKLKMLAVDLGATSGRGIIGSFDGKKLTLEENHRFDDNSSYLAGTLHWNIADIYENIKTAIRKSPSDIRSIGIDTWGVDYGLIGRDGRLLGLPINYRDARTDGMIDYTDRLIPRSELYGTTGIQLMNFNTVYQLLSELRTDPKAFDSARKLLMIPDLLNYLLTGEELNEYTNATTGALVDARTRDWAKDMLTRLGIPTHILGDLVAPGSTVGSLRPDVLREVGDISAKVVTVASHDTASAIVSVPADGEDFVYISSGTWSLMGTELKSPVISPETLKYSFTNEGGAEGRICFLTNIMGLWIHTECRRDFAKQDGYKTSYDELSELAAKSRPMRSIIAPNDVIFTPPGNMTGRIADYCRRTGQPVPETKGEFVRCVFDSLALCYRDTLRKIEELTGKKTPFINVVGGGSKETLLCQYTADACGIPVYAGPSEATAIGNLAVQAIAAGEIRDIAQAREVVRASFDVTEYVPSTADRAVWDAGYERYLRLTAQL